MALDQATLREELTAFASGALRLEMGSLAAELKQDIQAQLQQFLQPQSVQATQQSSTTLGSQQSPTPVMLTAQLHPPADGGGFMARRKAARQLSPEAFDDPGPQPTLGQHLGVSGVLAVPSHEWASRRMCHFGRGRTMRTGYFSSQQPVSDLNAAAEAVAVEPPSEPVTRDNANDEDWDTGVALNLSASLETLGQQLGPGQQEAERTASPGQIGGNDSRMGEPLGSLARVEAWTPTSNSKLNLSMSQTSISQQAVAEHESLPYAFGRAGAHDNSGESSRGLSEIAHCRALAKVVRHPFFDYVVGLMVFLNAVVIGVQVDYVARTRVETVPFPLRICEVFLCAAFSVEMLLRIMVHRSRYFYRDSQGWMKWNLFDFCIVSSQILEEILLSVFLARESLRMNLTFMRCLRILRYIRVLRGFRILRLIGKLRTLIECVQKAVSSLAWAVVLLGLVIYVTALWFTQIVADFEIHNEGNQHSSDLQFYFGSVGSTTISLYQSVTGGLDWRDAVQPLSEAISPAVAAIFSMYIAFVVLAMLNIVTGVFVHSAMSDEKEATDLFMKNNISELFGTGQDSTDCTQSLDLVDFEKHLDDNIMQEYFKAIDVDPSEAKGVFELLDIDASGSVDAEEFLSGCLRLRGPARALELELVMHEMRMVHKEVSFLLSSFQAYMEQSAPRRPSQCGPTPMGQVSDILRSALDSTQENAATLSVTQVM